MARGQCKAHVYAVVRSLVLAAVAAGLAGCYTTREVTDTIPNDYRLRHPITVQESERKVALFIGNQRGSLTPAQRADTIALARAWKRESTSGIIIDVPAGTPNQRSATEAAREVKALLFAAEVPAHVVAVRSYHPLSDDKLATLNVKYTRMTGDAGPCGLWPKDLGPDADPLWRENRPYWNLGCAYQRNIAAMVDNPGDLVQPRGETPIYTPRRNMVLDKYRKGESPATIYPDTSMGKISDVGK